MMAQEESTLRISDPPDTETRWALLERLAASAQLKRSARLQELLFYIGKRSLKDGCDRIHEQEIGAQVFKRPDSYDTSVDNIVRTNVSDLRKRIEAYFNSEGLHEPLLMEIPRGSYIPVFHYRSADAETITENPAEFQMPGVEQASLETAAPKAASLPVWVPVTLVVAAVLLAGAAFGCLFYWQQYRTLHQRLFSWQDKPTVAAFWSRFLNNNPSTDIVMSDTGVGMAEALTQQNFTLNDYLTRNYITDVQKQNLSPDMHAALNRILAWNLASPDEFVLTRRILGLDPFGNSIHFYNARNYMPDLIRRDNVILLGARKSNPWDELYDSRMNFITEFDTPRVVNRAPAPGEKPVYYETDSDGYCVVAFFPNTDNNGLVLLIEGTNAEATEAAGDFLLSEDQLSSFKKMLHVQQLPYFQVLLKVSAVRGTPLSASIAAYRIGPSSN